MSIQKDTSTYANSITIRSDFYGIMFIKNPVEYMGNVDEIVLMRKIGLYEDEYYPMLF